LKNVVLQRHNKMESVEEALEKPDNQPLKTKKAKKSRKKRQIVS